MGVDLGGKGNGLPYERKQKVGILRKDCYAERERERERERQRQREERERERE